MNTKMFLKLNNMFYSFDHLFSHSFDSPVCVAGVCVSLVFGGVDDTRDAAACRGKHVSGHDDSVEVISQHLTSVSPALLIAWTLLIGCAVGREGLFLRPLPLRGRGLVSC